MLRFYPQPAAATSPNPPVSSLPSWETRDHRLYPGGDHQVAHPKILREAIVQKIPFFMKFFRKRGGSTGFHIPYSEMLGIRKIWILGGSGDDLRCFVEFRFCREIYGNKSETYSLQILPQQPFHMSECQYNQVLLDLDWYFWINWSSGNVEGIDTWTAYDADDNCSLIGTFGSTKCQL